LIDVMNDGLSCVPSSRALAIALVLPSAIHSDAGSMAAAPVGPATCVSVALSRTLVVGVTSSAVIVDVPTTLFDVTVAR
jgi:hypothetical protein